MDQDKNWKTQIFCNDMEIRFKRNITAKLQRLVALGMRSREAYIIVWAGQVYEIRSTQLWASDEGLLPHSNALEEHKKLIIVFSFILNQNANN